MGKTVDTWLCPACNSEMTLEAWKNPSGKKAGFSLTCKGTDAVPHRLRIQLEGFRPDVSFLPAKVASIEPKKNSRVKELLERAARLEAA